MVNVIWTGDTLAIVWFWQVSNPMYIPYCVWAVAEEIDNIWYMFCAAQATAALCAI